MKSANNWYYKIGHDPNRIQIFNDYEIHFVQWDSENECKWYFRKRVQGSRFKYRKTVAITFEEALANLKKTVEEYNLKEVER